jgi:hypothetical protein
MRRAIRVRIGDAVAHGELHDGLTATRIGEAWSIQGQTSCGGDEIRPARAVNLVGKMEGDLRILQEVQKGMIVRLEKKQEVTT